MSRAPAPWGICRAQGTRAPTTQSFASRARSKDSETKTVSSSGRVGGRRSPSLRAVAAAVVEEEAVEVQHGHLKRSGWAPGRNEHGAPSGDRRSSARGRGTAQHGGHTLGS
jgi:hypothetical protein